MHVAVLGAGVSGLATLHVLVHTYGLSNVLAFEQAPTVGGLWVYTDKTGVQENGLPVHSSIYKNMTTNLPKEFQTFPGFDFQQPHPDGGFLKSEDVLQYLNDFADKYHLEPVIQFNTLVENVIPTEDEHGRTKWEVFTKNVTDLAADAHKHMFDAIFVCTGKESVPLIPDLPGLDLFKGKVMHSRDFRTADAFHDQTVVCLGAGYSGLDLCLFLGEVAKKIYLCSRSMKPFEMRNTKVCPSIQSVGENSVLLQDGRTLKDIDAIILCTGYKYSFPFLTEKCRIKAADDRITPLYKHIINVEWPTMYFIGTIKNSFSFRMYYMQAEFAAAALMGKVSIPSKQDMLDDIEEDLQLRKSLGIPSLPAHSMFPVSLLESYCKSLLELAEPGSVTPVPVEFIHMVALLLKIAFTEFQYAEMKSKMFPVFCMQDS